MSPLQTIEGFKSDGQLFQLLHINGPVAMDRDTNVAALNKQLESQPSSLDNWISNGNTFI